MHLLVYATCDLWYEQYACVVIKGVLTLINQPIKCNDVRQRGRGSHVFAVSQQFLCLVKTSYLGVDKQNRHCRSVQKRRHLTRGVCECQSPPAG